MNVLSDCKNSLCILSLLIYYNTNSIFIEHFFKKFFKICTAFAGKILGKAGRLLETAGKNSQKTPSKFPANSLSAVLTGDIPAGKIIVIYS